MKVNRNTLLRVCAGLSAFGLLSTPALAATRTAYFNQSGMNKTINGLADPGADSTCKITISNPSPVTQGFYLTVSASSLNGWGGGDSGTSSPGSWCATCNTASSGASVSCVSAQTGNCTGSLPSGANVQITFNFDHYPSRTSATNTQNTYQKLRCSGSIVANDVTQPGFLIANGVLVTFVESAKMSTDGVTSNTTQAVSFGGIAVYTQVPISINRAKPF